MYSHNGKNLGLVPPRSYFVFSVVPLVVLFRAFLSQRENAGSIFCRGAG